MLLPGEATELSVRLVIPTRLGPLTETMAVHSDDLEHPVRRLTVKAFLHADCFVLPESLIVDALCLDERRDIDLDVTGPADDDSFAIGTISTSSVQVMVGGVRKVQGASISSRPTWRVALTVAAKGLSTWEDMVLISTTGKVNRSLKVPLSVTERPPIRCDPPLVILRANGATGEVTGRLAVSSTISAKVTVLRIEKPSWLDVAPRPNANDLPMELDLTGNGESHSIGNGRKGGLVFVFADRLPSTRIPILLLR